MRLIVLLFIVFLTLPEKSAAQFRSQNKKLDAMIRKGMDDWNIPGLATVVVKNGNVVFLKTYGVKNIKTRDPVDAHTLFNMASTTKALIAISIGMLVDEGKLDWDDKVYTHLPGFRLSDAYIEHDARVVDLLTHNLGIGNADYLWILDSLSTKETLKRFQKAKKAYPLRGGFVYQNIMYAIAGELIGAVSGKHWTQFVTERILTPLGMDHTYARSVEILKDHNKVTPYFNDTDEGLVQVGYTLSDQIGAAGMIWSDITDISHYLEFLTGKGVFRGDRLLREKTFEQLFKPHSFVTDAQFYPTQNLTYPNWKTYGLGWFQQDYRGQKLDFHTGSISGLVALAAVMHSQDLAVYVFANLDHAELRHAIMLKAIDLYGFNDDSNDWNKAIFELYDGFREQEIKQRQKQEEMRVKNTRPTFKLEEYTGTYTNDMLGKAEVFLEKGMLHIRFNNYLTFELKHWHYDTFMTNKDPKWRFKAPVTFEQNSAGKIAALMVFQEKFTRSFKSKPQ